MSRDELLEALRRMMPETGSLACLGCGYEHRCSTHGCAICREAIALIEQLSAELERGDATRQQEKASDSCLRWAAEKR